MFRLIANKFVQWKTSSNRKPLIVRGARQVGKSYSIMSFGQDYYDGEVHCINFEKRPAFHAVFEPNFDMVRIVDELEILLNKKINSNRDLLFFDEIQECPKAIASLRYFYEQTPDIHVIAAGSLLEFSLKDISFPVGRVNLLNMYPMNFYEFLLAVDQTLLADLLTKKPVKLSEPVHNKLMEWLRKYFFIGGMPECVNTFATTRSMKDVVDIQADLVGTFRQDFNKYAGKADKSCLDAVLLNAAQKVGSQIKYAELAVGFSNPTIKKAFELLETAQLIKKVKAASPAGIPLGATASEKKFKAVMLDIGLMANLCGLNLVRDYLSSELLAIFRGAMAEQFVGQEILSATNSDLYYWSREKAGSNAETDYLMAPRGEIIPVEVKSGKGGSIKSLHVLLDKYQNIHRALVFSDAPFGQLEEQKITFLPLYYVYSSTIEEF